MIVKNTLEKWQWTNVWNQYLSAATANLIIFSHGAIVGWVSPALPFLTSAESPLVSGPLSNEQVSWIGSINCLGALMGTISLGWFISLMGCKRAVLVLTIPTAAFWFLIYFGNQYYHILIARVFSGGLVALTLYISEIANDDIRGRLAGTTMISRNVGVLIGYFIGAIVDYQFVPCISVIFPIVFAISFILLPNTPQFYLRKGQIQNAERALKFYKGYKGGNEREDTAIHNELERLKSIANERKTEENIRLSDFCDRSALKGLGIGFALTTVSQFTANFTITSYAVMIFEKTETDLDPHISSMILGIALLFGSILTTYMADSFGRKFLNIFSLVGSAFGLTSVSLYLYFHENGYDMSAFEWVPVISLSFVIFISSAGIFSLALVCSVEYLPPKIRTGAFALVCTWINVVTFICVKMFPILQEMINLQGCMIIFGIGSAFGAIFVYFVCDETSGQSLDDVGLDEKKKTDQIHVARLNSLS